MKIRNLGIVCLAAILVAYLGVTLYTSVHIAANTRDSTLLGPMFFSENSGIRKNIVPLGDPLIVPLGDPLIDPRPH